MNEIASEIEIFHEDPCILLSGFPIPSGNSKTSETWSYDQNRFYQTCYRSSVDVQFPRQGKKQQALIKQTWDFLKEFIKDVNYVVSSTSFVALSRWPMPSEQVIEPWLKQKSLSLELKTSGCDFSPEVLRFGLQQNLSKYLPIASGLIRSSFPSLLNLFPEVEEDPETNEKWLNFKITVQGEVDEILENYDHYISLFVSKVPFPERDKIRLTYNII